jgi:ribosome-binding factor A
MEGNRLQKVARLIQKDMGDILQLEAKNLFCSAMITVTKATVSADISTARLYVSILAIGKTTKEEIFALLEQNRRLLRIKLAQRVRHQLRIVPDIHFFIDDSLDYAQNIDNLLKQ